MGLKSQLFGSIMPARKRSVATLALHSCPLPAAPAKVPEPAEGPGLPDTLSAGTPRNAPLDRRQPLEYFK